LKDSLLVPLRDVDGNLHGLQFIQPDGSKNFLTGSAIAGHYFAIGKPRGRIIVCEGMATGATLHELTGDAVAVAFNAGNLTAVAKAIRAKLPALELVIAADNDHRTDGNPGMTKAREAAQAVGGVFIAPEFAADDDGTDYNDYCAQHGQDATREAIRAALAACSPPPQATPAPEPQSESAPRAEPATVVSLDSRRKAKAQSGAKPTQRSDYAAGFTLDAGGVWFRGYNKGGDGLEPPFHVGPPLRVIARLRDTGNENWGSWLAWEDADGISHRWGMPWQMLKGTAEEVRGELLRLGYPVPMSGRARSLLGEYLSQARPPQTARSVERVGWHDRVFVMPESTIGDAAEPVFFQCETTAGHIYRERAELSAWRSDIADLCRSNSRLLFAVSAAFAGPLLHWAGDESGGFNLRGPSSCGKTTALRVAASVWGGPSYVRRWRATDNALEAIATQHSDSLLVLDELAQIDPRIAGEAA
jgi:putative DNA primase/helicase